MLSFTAIIKRFSEKGEKTGWTYIDVPAAIASQLKPGNRKGFSVKGKLDDYYYEGLNLLPMGEGNFILTLNAGIRKAIRKQKGATLKVLMEPDDNPYQLNSEFVECLADDPEASAVFNALPNSHKNYYSKWIDSAKTDATKAKRIAMVISGLAQGLDFGGILRKARDEKRLLGQ